MMRIVIPVAVENSQTFIKLFQDYNSLNLICLKTICFYYKNTPLFSYYYTNYSHFYHY